MKTKALILVAALTEFLVYSAHAQTITESTHALTKQAQKGYIDDVKFDPDGTIHVIYQMRISKKSDEINYEDYAFGKDLKFIEDKPTSVAKQTKEDKEVKRLGAYVGGCTSFDILSMKLRIVNKKVKLSDWNYKRQRYDQSDIISSETVKLKNEEGKAYRGVEEFWNEEDDKLMIIAYTETKDKENPKQYTLVIADFDGNVVEKPIDISGKYSLAYTQAISEEQAGKAVGKDDFIIVFAPKKGSPNTSEYVYLHYDVKGNLKNKLLFQSPSPNLLINNATVIDGSVFMFANSLDSKAAYNEEFQDYAPIDNPCYGKNTTYGAQNYQMDKYMKRALDDMDNFHVLKITGNKLDFATTAPVKDLKSKVKTPPNDRGSTPYKGKKFVIAKFEVTPSNEFLIAGQLFSRARIGDLKHPKWVPAYGDIVCLHLDANGNLKAQYAVDKMFETKKSVFYQMPQSFYFTPDGKSAYWEIMEVKGEKDIWFGNFFNPQYYPRIAKINLQETSISDFKVFGKKKFFVYKSFPSYYLANEGSMVYFGKDDDEENLWVGKAKFD